MATLNLGRIKPVFRGAYAGGTAYVVDDIVTSGNETFICILASTGNATSNATYWTKLAAKGTDGTDVGATLTTQGDLLYRDGSGLQRLAKPASNKVLQNTSGGVLSWETVSSDAVKISDTTVSGTPSSFYINGCFTSDYKLYHILFYDILFSTSAQLKLQGLTATDTAYTSSHYNSLSSAFYGQASTGQDGHQNYDVDYWRFSAGWCHYQNDEGFVDVWFHNPAHATQTTMKSTEGVFEHSGTQNIAVSNGAGSLVNNAVLTGLKVYATSGNINQMQVKIYGYK